MTAVPPARDGFAVDPTALDRSVRFELVFNVRDLGGLPAADGRTVRPGHLYRADGVQRPGGRRPRSGPALRLSTVIDLRTEGEIERTGRFPVDQLPVDWHHLPILERMWSEDDLVAVTGAVDFLCERYVEMLDSGAATSSASWSWWRTACPPCSTPRPARTGPGWWRRCCSGCSVWRRSHRRRLPRHRRCHGRLRRLAHHGAPGGHGLDDEPAPRVPGGAPGGDEPVLAHVDERHGSMEGLADHLGIDDRMVVALREALLA